MATIRTLQGVVHEQVNHWHEVKLYALLLVITRVCEDVGIKPVHTAITTFNDNPMLISMQELII